MTRDERDPAWLWDDRRWAARHPHRRYRLRRFAPGETFWCEDETTAGYNATLVCAFQPGLRGRMPFRIPEEIMRVRNRLSDDDLDTLWRDGWIALPKGLKL